MEAARLGGPALAGDVRLARRVLANEDDRETRPKPMRNERPRVFGDVDKRLVGDRRAIKDKGGCVGHRSSSRKAWEPYSGRKTKRASWRARSPGSSTRMLGFSNKSPVKPTGSL